ncbi:RNA polymerase sigma factor [Cellulomonas palmilytica]|uniref:RNA polymerase sigma factor n=1 Tax=Cellulomonas palmilytica TaxID=2608402 RepID=UPI001F39B765|nr:sigma-70 family RNA polymerase sigma factor [Cellulomonas palmilytica]
MSDARAATEAVFRVERTRLVGGLLRYVGDVGLAEDLAQDALVAALEQWPADGVPRNPGAWLMTVARRRAVDLVRRDRVLADKYALVAPTLQSTSSGPDEEALDGDGIDDDVLRLVFVACHPVLPPAARVALALRLLGGLTTAEIARAYGQPETTVAQRISRAKKTIAQAGAPFEVPTGDDRAARLPSVLEVVYLVFNEGYTATAGDDWARPELCFEALRLARVLAALLPDEPEVLGLQALLELQSSRLDARVGPDGAPVLLADQDRRRWDRLLIRRGLDALARAEARGGRGPYVLQAAIAACHARAFSVDETDWTRIAALYAELVALVPSPVVELNRAVAVARAVGPQEGLDVVDALAATGTLDAYHLLPSVRADLLVRLGRVDEARGELVRAAGMTANLRERDLLLRRWHDLDGTAAPADET